MLDRCDLGDLSSRLPADELADELELILVHVLDFGEYVCGDPFTADYWEALRVVIDDQPSVLFRGGGATGPDLERDSARRVISSLGIPVIHVPSYAEVEAAYLATWRESGLSAAPSPAVLVDVYRDRYGAEAMTGIEDWMIAVAREVARSHTRSRIGGGIRKAWRW